MKPRDYSNLTKDEREALHSASLTEKITQAQLFIAWVFEQYSVEETAVAWTGGKDSTLLLWLVKKVCEDKKIPLPTCLFIDEGDVFEEIRSFVDELTQSWGLRVEISHNSDVSSQVNSLGDEIEVSSLNKRNQAELKKLGFTDKSFPYKPESFVGNHLMKTVATNLWLEKSKRKILFVGVRWDEQEARSEDNFLRTITEPQHFRAEPILPFYEQDVWDAIHQNEIPYVDLYKKGYRSLGAKSTTGKTSSKPAWEQDLKNTTEREGRQQDKEKVMQRLRDLGYM